MVELLDLIRCPVTKQIFNTPIIASDGTVYEAEVAFNLIESKKESTITGKVLEKDIRIVITLKSLISMLLDKFEYLKEHQYKTSIDITKMYHFNKIEILSIFANRVGYNKLLNYDTFVISDIDSRSFADFLSYATHDTIVHFLNKCDNLNYRWMVTNPLPPINNVTMDVPAWSVINYICKNAPSSIVKHVLTQYSDIDYENDCSNGWKPIHQVVTTYDGECVRLMIDRNVDLMSKTQDNITAFEYIIGSHGIDTIKHAINKVHMLNNLSLPILFVRLEDNEKINDSEKGEINAIMISKYM
jgi:hypothetical protein